jgi:phosphoadenosine phosphosulfate reductase
VSTESSTELVQGGGGAPAREGPPDELLAEIDEVSRKLEEAGAAEAIRWTVERFGEDVVVASSFQDCALIHLAVGVLQSIEVVFLDTGFHFRQTLDFVDTCRSVFEPLNLVVLTPGPEAAPWPCGSDRCCETRKVLPLARHLEGRPAWITGLKRVDTPERTAAPIVSWDAARGLVKVNPVASWNDDDIDAYLAEHGLPVHPLVAEGYRSIGCAPTTRPTAAGEDPRAGRWSGTGKTECGLHV